MHKLKLGKIDSFPGPKPSSMRKLVKARKRFTHKAWRRAGKAYLDDAPEPPYYWKSFL